MCEQGQTYKRRYKIDYQSTIFAYRILGFLYLWQKNLFNNRFKLILISQSFSNQFMINSCEYLVSHIYDVYMTCAYSPEQWNLMKAFFFKLLLQDPIRHDISSSMCESVLSYDSMTRRSPHKPQQIRQHKFSIILVTLNWHFCRLIWQIPQLKYRPKTVS